MKKLASLVAGATVLGTVLPVFATESGNANDGSSGADFQVVIDQSAATLSADADFAFGHTEPDVAYGADLVSDLMAINVVTNGRGYNVDLALSDLTFAGSADKIDQGDIATNVEEVDAYGTGVENDDAGDIANLFESNHRSYAPGTGDDWTVQMTVNIPDWIEVGTYQGTASFTLDSLDQAGN